MGNFILLKIGSFTGLNPVINNFSNGQFSELSLQYSISKKKSSITVGQKNFGNKIPEEIFSIAKWLILQNLVARRRKET